MNNFKPNNAFDDTFHKHTLKIIKVLFEDYNKLKGGIKTNTVRLKGGNVGSLLIPPLSLITDRR